MPEEKKLLSCCISSMSMMETFLQHLDRTNPDDVAKGNKYFNWVNEKTNKVITENDLNIPSSFLPMRIEEFTFNNRSARIQTLITQYYKKIPTNNGVIYKKDMPLIGNMTGPEIEILAKSLVLIPRKVVWVDFGFNIGSEFGGKHPAVVLKKAGDSLIVVPVSSTNVNRQLPYVVDIPKIYGFNKQMARWTSVDRITPISPKRIDFTSPVGEIKAGVFNSIKAGIRREIT